VKELLFVPFVKEESIARWVCLPVQAVYQENTRMVKPVHAVIVLLEGANLFTMYPLALIATLVILLIDQDVLLVVNAQLDLILSLRIPRPAACVLQENILIGLLVLLVLIAALVRIHLFWEPRHVSRVHLVRMLLPVVFLLVHYVS